MGKVKVKYFAEHVRYNEPKQRVSCRDLEIHAMCLEEICGDFGGFHFGRSCDPHLGTLNESYFFPKRNLVVHIRISDKPFFSRITKVIYDEELSNPSDLIEAFEHFYGNRQSQ